jgi:hypothetical protein
MFFAWLWNVGINAVTTAMILAVVAWLLRTWIKERLSADIRTETETKLVGVRDQLHRETETELTELRTRLSAAETKLSEARKAGIDANQQLYTAVVPEQIAGLKGLWTGIRDARAINVVSIFVSVMDLAFVRKSIGDQKFTNQIGMMLKQIDHMELLKRLKDIEQWRPFVTERAWALFAAYHLFYTTRLLRGIALSMGSLELAERLWQVNSELTIVQATATPEIAAQYAENAFAGTAPFLSYVEKELLDEFARSLRGEHSGTEAARRAAEIIKVIETVAAANTEAQVPPT